MGIVRLSVPLTAAVSSPSSRHPSRPGGPDPEDPRGVRRPAERARAIQPMPTAPPTASRRWPSRLLGDRGL